ncbi:o-antigen ligase [Lucifera butyrica]|uniref:O-antigen ligase n=1 Tax=Lucifera butyrica TaxID=1351585 RepID=A0A498R597_9FIRM|nr:O-antigen ligase family protein [Lucifera butyrica]VBB06319.1 o-antigen ligase [Lucifera butyrica]
MHISYRFTQIQYHLDYLIEHCVWAVAFFLPLSLNVSSVFLLTGSLAWAGKMILSRRLLFKRTMFDEAIFLLVLLSGLSIFVSPNKDFSFYNYYHLMGRYILLYYFVVSNIRSRSQLKSLVWALLGAAFVVSVYGLYQYVHGVDISTFQWVDDSEFPDLKTRIFSTLYNPNLLAGFLVIMMAIAGGIGIKSDNVRRKIVLALLVAILGLCLVLTYSRGAWLSILVIFVTYGIIYNRKVLWLLFLIPIMVFFAHDAVGERLVSIFNPTDTSATMRMAIWESTLSMIMDHPFLGIGWGAYWLVYPKYDFFIQDAAVKIYHAHNMYLHIAAEIGIPGLLVFLTIMIGHARAAYCVLRSTQDRWLAGLMLGVLSAILGLAVSGFTDYVMYNVQMSMLYWLLNAMIVSVCQEKGCHSNQWMV